MLKKKIILIVFGLSLLDLHLFSQQQFRFRYTFRQPFVATVGGGDFYEVFDTPAFTIPTIFGPITFPAISRGHYPRTIVAGMNLQGRFKINETKDTIIIEGWYPGPLNINVPGTGATANTLNDYSLPINAWETNLRGNPCITIPYRTRLLTAINIPIKITCQNPSAKADFLNLGVAGYLIWGSTRVFRSKFIEPRDRFCGFGLFVGAGARDEDHSLGLNYGLSTIFSLYSINLLVAFGTESSVDGSHNTWNPYWGLGLGVKIVELTP